MVSAVSGSELTSNPAGQSASAVNPSGPGLCEEMKLILKVGSDCKNVIVFYLGSQRYYMLNFHWLQNHHHHNCHWLLSDQGNLCILWYWSWFLQRKRHHNLQLPMLPNLTKYIKKLFCCTKRLLKISLGQLKVLQVIVSDDSSSPPSHKLLSTVSSLWSWHTLVFSKDPPAQDASQEPSDHAPHAESSGTQSSW